MLSIDIELDDLENDNILIYSDALFEICHAHQSANWGVVFKYNFKLLEVHVPVPPYVTPMAATDIVGAAFTRLDSRRHRCKHMFIP